MREIKAYLKDKNRSKFKILPIGEKGSAAMMRPFPDLIKFSITDIPSPRNFPLVMAISDEVAR